MSVLSHPANPSDRNWAILADFPTGRTTMLPDHRLWLDAHVVVPTISGVRLFVFLRGFASRLGQTEANRVLSLRRVLEVQRYLLHDVALHPDRVSGLDWRGEEWSEGSDRDDRASRRSVEVIVTHSLPPPRPIRVVRPPADDQDRVVECSLITAPRTMGMARQEPGEATFEAYQQAREAHSVHTRLNCTSQRVPSTHRITRIEFELRTRIDDVLTVTQPVVHFIWEQDPGDSVELQAGTARITISRLRAREIYRDPARFLATHDPSVVAADQQGAVVANLRWLGMIQEILAPFVH